MKVEELKKTIDNLWKNTKKDLDKVLKETATLVKKGESYIKDISEKGKKNLEILKLSVEREKLYYQLGKTISSLSKNKWKDNKKVNELVTKIRKISRQIKSKK